MRLFLRATVAAAVLLGAAPFVASAQTTIIERPGYIQLSPSQRTVIQRHVIRERRVAPPPAIELRVGTPVPPAVQLYSFPEEVYVEVPRLQRYRYFYVDDEIALVDPETSEIIEIIRE